jgi:hypothetical protein
LGTSRPSYSEHKRVGLIAEKPTGVATCKTATILSGVQVSAGGGNCKKNSVSVPFQKPGTTLQQFMIDVGAAESGGGKELVDVGGLKIAKAYTVRREDINKAKCPDGVIRRSQYWGKYQLGNGARLTAFKEAIRIYKFLKKTPKGNAGGVMGERQTLGDADYKYLFEDQNGPLFLGTQKPKAEGGTKNWTELLCEDTNKYPSAKDAGRWNQFVTYHMKGGLYKNAHLQDLLGGLWFHKGALDVMNMPAVTAIINKGNKWGMNGDVKIPNTNFKVDLSSLVAVWHILGTKDRTNTKGLLPYLRNPGDLKNADQLGTTALCYAMKFYGYNLFNIGS